jgi:hypothetical protein
MTTTTIYEVGYHNANGDWLCYETAHDLLAAREVKARLAVHPRAWMIMRKTTVTTTALVDDDEN